MRTAFASILTAALISACAQDNSASSVETQVVRAGETTLRCLDDTKLVRFEHSGNCLAAARLIYGEAEGNRLRDHCGDSPSRQCQRIARETIWNELRYWRAVSHSLMRHGRPRLPAENEGRPFVSTTANREINEPNFYRHVASIEAAFADCLRLHPDPATDRYNDDRPTAEQTSARDEPVLPQLPPSGNEHCLAEGYVAPKPL